MDKNMKQNARMEAEPLAQVLSNMDDGEKNVLLAFAMGMKANPAAGHTPAPVPPSDKAAG